MIPCRLDGVYPQVTCREAAQPNHTLSPMHIKQKRECVLEDRNYEQEKRKEKQTLTGQSSTWPHRSSRWPSQLRSPSLVGVTKPSWWVRRFAEKDPDIKISMHLWRKTPKTIMWQEQFVIIVGYECKSMHYDTGSKRHNIRQKPRMANTLKECWFMLRFVNLKNKNY